ncbi:MAG TPA: pre-toxin TG domain-containing protein [Micromonosporaceae bacterium]|nr:pre-toxin TG domain-containing protein [Micromonosporaceae bacterium]
MNRAIRHLLVGVLAGTLTYLAYPTPAYADNCSSLSDCYRTAQAALAALIGLSVLFGVLLSLALDFTPVVGTTKGVVEAVTGRDLITGQELAWWERMLGIVPVLGGVAGLVGAAARGAGALDGIADAGRAADRASGGWSGARYVDDVSAADARAYDAIRANTGDTARIAENTGIPQNQLDQVKDHVFNREHDLPTGPGQIQRGNFSPDPDIADLWGKAEAGKLTGPEAKAFNRLIAHEYMESSLMNNGMPYRSSDPGAWDPVLGNNPTPQHHGAHDLSPHGDPNRDPFGHWGPNLGREHPGITEIGSDMSILDDIIRHILGGGGK